MPPYVLPIDPDAKPKDNHGPGPDPNPVGRRLEEAAREARDDENLDPNLTALALPTSPGDAFAHGGAGRERDYCPRCDTYHDSDECPIKPIPVPKIRDDVRVIKRQLEQASGFQEQYKTQTVGEAHSRGCIYRQELVRLSDGAILATLNSSGTVTWVDRNLFTAKERIAIRKALAEENLRWRAHQRTQAQAQATRAAIRSGLGKVNPLLRSVAVDISGRGAVSTEAPESREHPALCTCRLCRPDLYPRPATVSNHRGVPIRTVEELHDME